MDMAAGDVVVGSGAALHRIAGDRARDEAVVVCGVSERVGAGPGRGTLYNTLLTIGPDGELLNHHRKLVPTYTERMVWGNGDADGVRAVDTPSGRAGGLVCWEHWMPLARQALHDSGEDIHAALWPTVHDRHQLASRHYAFEGRCFVLAAGQLIQGSTLPKDLRAPSGQGEVTRRPGAEWRGLHHRAEREVPGRAGLRSRGRAGGGTRPGAMSPRRLHPRCDGTLSAA